MKKEIVNLFEELEKIKAEIPKSELRKNKRFIEIRNTIAEKNLKLVRYRVQHIVGSQPEDLIEAGNEGLLTAIEKYDLSMGTELSTYAIYWIDQFIHREMIVLSNHASIPVHKYEKIKTALTKLDKIHHDPKPEEISEATGIEIAEVIAILNAMNNVSLNYQPDDDSEMMEAIPNSEIPIEDQVETSMINEELLEFLEKELTKTEFNVIKLRYGLIDGRRRTLEEIAEMNKVTRERIRQLEERALRKLRKSKDVEAFAIYMDDPDKCKKSKGLSSF